MKGVQTRTLEAYQRIVGFLTANGAVLGAVLQLAAVATLTGIVATLMGSDAEQEAAIATRKGLSHQAKTLRAALVATMRQIAAIAADTVATIPQLPGLAAPASNVSNGALVGRANGMVDAATPYEQAFIAAGLPTTFLADLSAAAAKLSEAITSQGMSKSQRVKATQGVASGLKAARAQLKIIDPAVVQALTGNAPLLKQWANVKRITSKTSVSTTAATTTTAAADSAAPVSAAHAPATTSTPEVKAA